MIGQYPEKASLMVQPGPFSLPADKGTQSLICKAGRAVVQQTHPLGPWWKPIASGQKKSEENLCSWGRSKYYFQGPELQLREDQEHRRTKDDWPSPPCENAARRPSAHQEESFHQKPTPMAPLFGNCSLHNWSLPGVHITVDYPVPLGFSWLWQFLRLSLFIKTLTIWRTTGQKFCLTSNQRSSPNTSNPQFFGNALKKKNTRESFKMAEE